MPTGYTYCLQKGATMEEFIRGATKAFISETSPQCSLDYYTDRKAEIEDDIAHVSSMTEEELTNHLNTEFEKSLDDYAQHCKDTARLESIYTRTLEKVRSLNLPKQFKDFLIEQLELSIKTDCTSVWKPTYPNNPLKDLKDELARTNAEIEKYTRET